MKLRTGFVSNSSSTSFCIYGTYINFYQVDNEYSIEQIIEFFEDESLYAIYDRGNEHLYAGRCWGTIADEETGKQFKEETEKKILKVIEKHKLDAPIIHKCQTIVDTIEE